MEKFCKDLREHTIRITNYEKKEMIPLTDEENRSDKKKFTTYVKKNLILMKMIKMNLNYTIKSEIIVITLQNLEELSQYLQFKIKIIKGNSNSVL